jgi:hypothetical protein
MQLTNPIWLWGLLGLAVPLAIHLLSRKEGKVIKVGSIRHLSDSTTRQFKSIKLNELLLLALRSLLLAIIVVILSGLLLSSTRSLPRWVLLERGVERISEVQRIVDSLAAGGYEVRYFEKGFPTPEDTLPKRSLIDYWYLAAELNHEDIQEAIVFSKAAFLGFNGKRVQKPENVTWFDVPVYSNGPQTAFLNENDSLWEVTAEADDNFIGYSVLKSNEKRQSAGQVVSNKITIVYDDEHAYDGKLLAAALGVLNDLPGVQLEIEPVRLSSFTQGSSTYTFWLASSEAPDVSGKLIVLREDDSNGLLVRTAGQQWTLTKRLNKKTALEGHLISHLSKLLASEPPALAQFDQRVMPESWRWSKAETVETTGKAALAGLYDINEWLLALLVIILLTERLVAWRRGQ